MERYSYALRFVMACWIASLACGTGARAQQDAPPKKPATADDKIAYYQQQVEKHPKHYPAFARLGGAWLEKARASYNPQAVAEARRALQRSLEIQPNYEALHQSAAVANYSHRFDEALRWSQQAAEAFPEDKGVVAMQVEALLALGRGQEARALLGKSEDRKTDFYIAASLGHWHVAQGQREEAVRQFLAAAQSAKKQQVLSLTVWATVTAAGVWLDSGDLKQAKPLLDEAARLAPADRFLRIHQAELAAAEERPADALRIYQELLGNGPDPELHRRAYLLARQLGQPQVADEHYSAAESLCRRAIDAGEVFSLEVLANLYCDAGNFAQALKFAEENSKVKFDAAADETLARARQGSSTSAK